MFYPKFKLFNSIQRFIFELYERLLKSMQNVLCYTVCFLAETQIVAKFSYTSIIRSLKYTTTTVLQL